MVQTVRPEAPVAVVAYSKKKIITIIAVLLLAAVVFEVKRRSKINASNALNEAIDANSPERIRAAVIGGGTVTPTVLKTALSPSHSDEVGVAAINNYKGDISDEILTLALDQQKPLSVETSLLRGARLGLKARQAVIANRQLSILKAYLQTAPSGIFPSVFSDTIDADWQEGALAVAGHLKDPCQFADIANKEWVEVLEKLIEFGADTKSLNTQPKTEPMAIFLFDQGRKLDFNKLVNTHKWDKLFAKLYEREKKAGVLQFYKQAKKLPFLREKIVLAANIRKDLFDPISPSTSRLFVEIVDDIIAFKQCSFLTAEDTDSLAWLSHDKQIREGILKLAQAKTPVDAKTWIAKLASEHNTVTNLIPFLNDFAKTEPANFQEALDAAVNTAPADFALACVKLGAKPSKEKSQAFYNKILSDALKSKPIDEEAAIGALENDAHLDNDQGHKELYKQARTKKLSRIVSFLCKDLTKERFADLGMTIRDLTDLKEEKDCLNLDLNISLDDADHLLKKGWTNLANKALDKQGKPCAVFLNSTKEKKKAIAEHLVKTHPKDLIPDSIVNVMKNGWKKLAEQMIDEGLQINAICFAEAAYQGWPSTLQKLCDRNPKDKQQGLDAALETDTVWVDKHSDELCFFLLEQGAKPKDLQATIQKARDHGWTRVLNHLTSSLDASELQSMNFSVSEALKFCSPEQVSEFVRQGAPCTYQDYMASSHQVELQNKIRDHCELNAFFNEAMETGDVSATRWVLENRLTQLVNLQPAFPWALVQGLDDLADQLLAQGARLTTKALDQYKAKNKLRVAVDHLKSHPDQIEDDMLAWSVENEEEDLGLVVASKCSQKVQHEQYKFAVARGLWKLRDQLMFPRGANADLSKPCNVDGKAVIPIVKAIKDGKAAWAFSVIKRGAPINRTVMQAMLDHCEDEIMGLIPKAPFEEGALLEVVEAKKFELAKALVEAKKATPLEPGVLAAALQNGLDWFNYMRAFVSDDQLVSLPNAMLAAAAISGDEALADKALAQNVDIYASIDETGYNAFDYAVLNGRLKIAKKLLDVEDHHYKASQAADRIVTAVRVVADAVKEYSIRLLDSDSLTEMALKLQTCGSRSDQDEINAKKLIRIVENQDSDAKLIRDVYQKRFAPGALPAIGEIALKMQNFSKTLVNHKANDGKTLMRRAILKRKANPDMKNIDFLIDNGAKMFLGDLRLAAELDNKACAQKILRAFFNANEKLLEDPALFASFDDPVVLDCAHTVDQTTYDQLIKPQERQTYDYGTQLGRDEYGFVRTIHFTYDYTLETHQCPTCREKFTKGVPSNFTKRACELSEAQDEEDTPQQFLLFIDLAKDSCLEGVLAKEVIRQDLLKIVLHEGWAKKIV